MNAAGLPMRTDITPGQTSDYLGFDLVMDDNLPEHFVLLADTARDFDRQVAELQVGIAVLNGYTAFGSPVTEAVG